MTNFPLLLVAVGLIVLSLLDFYNPVPPAHNESRENSRNSSNTTD